ncbi:hypothetical protein LEP1GSC192_0130 [Leptospira sp. B5-022]|nr:hypothetical protein LEP1GSC192_0130 [Leptospira sp. B5-022]
MPPPRVEESIVLVLNFVVLAYNSGRVDFKILEMLCIIRLFF